MRPREDEIGLRLAAKAADREEAARQEWPAFESRLRELGYRSRAIAHAFRTLSGPGTVAAALAALKATSRPRSSSSALSFEVIETTGAFAESVGCTITSVERDDSGIRVSYELAPQLGVSSLRARAEARDDLGNDYADLGSHLGLVAGKESSGAMARARGGLSMPMPPPGATMLRVRVMWDPPLSSTGDQSAHEIRISLPSQPSGDQPQDTSA